jgi:hypothetical protein
METLRQSQRHLTNYRVGTQIFMMDMIVAGGTQIFMMNMIVADLLLIQAASYKLQAVALIPNS